MPSQSQPTPSAFPPDEAQAMQEAINQSLPTQYRKLQPADTPPAARQPQLPPLPNPQPGPMSNFAAQVPQPPYPPAAPSPQQPAPMTPPPPITTPPDGGFASPAESSAMSALAASQSTVSAVHPEFDPEKMNQLVGEVDGKLIPELLGLLTTDPSGSHDAIESKIQDGFALVSQIEMASDPEDVFHKQAIGELYGKLKLAESILTKLTER